MDQGQVHRREHRLHRHRDRSVEQQHPVRGELSAPPQRLLLQRWRARQRAVEDDRRRPDVDEADRQRAAAGHVRPHRARRLAVEPERRLRADRSGRNGRAGHHRRRRCRRSHRDDTAGARLPSRRRGAGTAGQAGRAGQAGQGGMAGKSKPVAAAAAAGHRSTGATTPARRADTWQAAAAVVVGRRAAAACRLDAAATRSEARRHLPLRQQGSDVGRMISNCNARPMYFSQIRVDPTNDTTIYVAGLPVAKSLDGGKTFTTLDAAGGHGSPGHVDQHAIWIDPKNPKHLMIGNDGGLNVSWDQGRTWDFVNTMATALAYVVTADMRPPVLRVHRPAGQRQLGRAERRARTRRHHELRLVRHRRRRRILHGRGSDRPQHRHHRIAERQHESLRPPHRCGKEHSSGGASTLSDGRSAECSGGRRGAGGAAWRGPGAAAGGRRRTWRAAERPERAAGRSVPLQLEHAGHPVAAQPEHRLAGRQPAVQVVQPGRHLDGERRSHEADRSQHRIADGRAGRPDAALEERRRQLRTARSSRCPNRRCCPASSGPAPTTGCCR